VEFISTYFYLFVTDAVIQPGFRDADEINIGVVYQCSFDFINLASVIGVNGVTSEVKTLDVKVAYADGFGFSLGWGRGAGVGMYVATAEE
jgi:hypothetical protein